MIPHEPSPQKRNSVSHRRRWRGFGLPASARISLLALAASALLLTSPQHGFLLRPALDSVSIALANPLRAQRVRQVSEPTILPLTDATEQARETGLTTPAAEQSADQTSTTTAIAGESLPVANSAVLTVTLAPLDETRSGVVYAGQQLPVAGRTPEATIDPDVINEMLEPLMVDQTEPTPLVIELQIPSGASAMSASGLETSGVEVPTGGSSAFPQVVLLPSPTPEKPTYAEAAAPYSVPQVEIVPAVGVRFTPTPTPIPTSTPAPAATNLWSATGLVEGRRWSTFTPRPPEESDHFWIGNPFANVNANRLASPNYQFGSTAGGRYRPHHGVDISNTLGTPLRAGVAGEVVFAGQDDPIALGPYPSFYGNAVVIRLDRRLPVAGGRLDVYVLYGHLNDVYSEVGQRIEPDDVVGVVGMTGIAIGPHLHVEVRLGANTYAHNVNPYLWMEPSQGTGAVAVRLLSKDNRTWAGAKISIARFENGKAVWARQIETYLDVENIGPDPAWGENGAMGDVPAGYYYLIGKVGDENIRAEFVVEPGKTTFVEIRTKQ